MLNSLRHLLTIFMIVSSSGWAWSQSGWEKTYDAAGSLGVNFDDIQFHDNNLIIRGNVYVNSDSIWGLLICAIDTNGLMLWQQTICDTSKMSHIATNTPSRFTITKNHKLIIPSKYYNLNEIVLFITDSLGQEITSQKYSHSNSTIFPLDVKIQDEKYFIFGHVFRENYRSDVFVIRTDTFGVFEWIKYYGTTFYNEKFGDVCRNENGTFTISSNRYTDDFSLEFDDTNWCLPWIFSIDTAGTIMKQWHGESNDPRSLGGGPFYILANGDYLVLSRDLIQAESPFDQEWRVSPSISRLDSNYNLIWKKNMTDFEERFDKFVDLEYDPKDDTYVAAGELFVRYGPKYFESEIWVVKFNADGEIIWNITDTVYFNLQERHFTAGLVIAPSGSIYVAGYVDRGWDEGWILKVTPDGCSDTICSITSIKDQLDLHQNLVRVYPIPSNDVFYIDLKDPPDHAYIILYDMMGRAMLHQKLQETSNAIRHSLPAGLYFHAVYANDSLIKSGKIVVK